MDEPDLLEKMVVYAPFSPSKLPMLASLYIRQGTPDAEKAQIGRQLAQTLERLRPAPAKITARLPDPGENRTILMVCHNQSTLDQALSLSESRPVIVWSWLLDEMLVTQTQARVPVVFGPQNTPHAMQRLRQLQPSAPDLAAVADSEACAAVEHGWAIPRIETA